MRGPVFPDVMCFNYHHFISTYYIIILLNYGASVTLHHH